MFPAAEDRVLGRGLARVTAIDGRRRQGATLHLRAPKWGHRCECEAQRVPRAAVGDRPLEGHVAGHILHGVEEMTSDRFVQTCVFVQKKKPGATIHDGSRDVVRNAPICGPRGQERARQPAGVCRAECPAALRNAYTTSPIFDRRRNARGAARHMIITTTHPKKCRFVCTAACDCQIGPLLLKLDTPA